jgi:phytoene synthase
MSANLIYAEIGHQLRRIGMDPVNQRSVVSGKRKLWLLARAWLQSRWVTVQRQQPQPLAGIAYLVEQCQLSAEALAYEPAMLSKPPRIESMLSMFERLEMQRRQSSGIPLNRFQR